MIPRTYDPADSLMHGIFADAAMALHYVTSDEEWPGFSAEISRLTGEFQHPMDSIDRQHMIHSMLVFLTMLQDELL